MRMIAIDDEELAVENISALLRRVDPDAEITGFTEPEDAFDYLAQNRVDIAFLDIEMRELSGNTRWDKKVMPGVFIFQLSFHSEPVFIMG